VVSCKLVSMLLFFAKLLFLQQNIDFFVTNKNSKYFICNFFFISECVRISFCLIFQNHFILFFLFSYSPQYETMNLSEVYFANHQPLFLSILHSSIELCNTSYYLSVYFFYINKILYLYERFNKQEKKMNFIILYWCCKIYRSVFFSVIFIRSPLIQCDYYLLLLLNIRKRY
jgi:hypothetical protein